MAKGQGRSSGQGVKLLYIRDYLYTHATKEHPKNAKDISKYLASMGVSASVKTIYNDILRLQIDFGVPIEYNPSKWGYYITQPQFEPYELRLLVDCVQSAKFLTENMAVQLTKKIKQLADVYTKDSLNRQAYVSNRVRNMNRKQCGAWIAFMRRFQGIKRLASAISNIPPAEINPSNIQSTMAALSLRSAHIL